MKKKDLRILWNTNKKGEINEFQLVGFNLETPDKWPMHLYKKFDKDIGNCLLHDWENMGFKEIVEYFKKDKWESPELFVRFIKELLEVEDV